MALVAAKCTNCGAALQIEHSKEAGICPHCGMAFITEKAITNYNITNVNYNTQNVVKNIYGHEKTEAEDHIRNGDVFILLGQYKEAQEQYWPAIKSNPANWQGWFGLAKSETQNFTNFLLDHEKGIPITNQHLDFLQKAKVVAPPEALQEIEAAYAFCSQKHQYFDERYKRKLRVKANLEQRGFSQCFNEAKRADDGTTNTHVFSVVQKALPVCPFCGEAEDWYMQVVSFNPLFSCPKCSAEMSIKFPVFGYKVKSIRIINAGEVNINGYHVGNQDPEEFLKACKP